MYLQNVTQTRSCNHICRRIAISITHSECVFVIVICGLSGSCIFFHAISQMAWFSGETVTEWVFWFFLQLMSETFLNLLWCQRDITKNVHWCSRKVPVILVDFNETRISSIKFHENPSSWSRVIPQERQTGKMNLIVAFRNLTHLKTKTRLHY
jgi:hypothetical protein